MLVLIERGVYSRARSYVICSFIHSIPSLLVWAENQVYNAAFVALPKWTISQFKPVQKNRR